MCNNTEFNAATVATPDCDCIFCVKARICVTLDANVEEIDFTDLLDMNQRHLDNDEASGNENDWREDVANARYADEWYDREYN